MAIESTLTRGVRLALVTVAAMLAAPASQPAVRAQAGLTLGLTVNQTALTPGSTLTTGVTVTNPGGGPLADFYFAVLLPDGATIVSAGPGVGARFGSLANLRSLVPVARSISLANPFPYAASPFFTYTFGGSEPPGVYRLLFAAFRSGALDDGVIGGGELLALATQDVTFGTSPITSDNSRAVTTVVPPGGGAVQTASANGTMLRLDVPAGSVSRPTAITIAPILDFRGAPGGPLVAGVVAEPSGLVLAPAATLTITLPPGFRPPPFGLYGFVTDDQGQHAERVPMTLVGNVATLTVPHFSAAGVALNSAWSEWCTTNNMPPDRLTACLDLSPIYDAEILRMLATNDETLSAGFKAAVQPPLRSWMTGLRTRLIDAQAPGAPDPQLKPLAALGEWFDWIMLYEGVFGGISDQTNGASGKPLGADIDATQAQARLTYISGENANNVKCLIDKEHTFRYVDNVLLLYNLYLAQLRGTTILQPEYCLGLYVAATPPATLTPGVVVPLPIDVGYRYTDGASFELALVSLVVTATNAAVSPAGGIAEAPIRTSLILAPSATSSVITISASPVAGPTDPPAIEFLPPVTRFFPIGQAGNITVVSASMGARVVAHVGGDSYEDSDARVIFAPTQSVSASIDRTGTSGRTTARAVTSSTSTRTVTQGASGLTISGSGSEAPNLIMLSTGSGTFPSTGTAVGGFQHSTCVALATPHVVTYAVGSTGPRQRPNSNNLVAQLFVDDESISAPGSGSLTLAAGNHCFSFASEPWSCTANNLDQVRCFTPQTLDWNYSVTLSPAP